MPLSVDNIVQSDTGTFEAGSGTVSLPAGTTAGSLVLVCVALASDTLVLDTDLKASGVTGGAGTFVLLSRGDFGGNTRAWAQVYAQRNVAAGETSWTVTAVTGTPQVAWAVFELSGVGLDPYPTWSDSDTCVDASTLVGSVPTIGGIWAPWAGGSTTCYETLGIGVFAATSADTTAPVFSSYTMDKIIGVTQEATEVAQVGRVNASTAMALSVSFTQVLDLDGFSATAAVSPNSYATSTTVLLYADHAAFRPDYAWIFGAEIGTGTNLSVGSAALVGTAPFDVVVGTPAIGTAHARSGNYALKLSSTSAAKSCSKTLADIGYSGQRYWSERFHFLFETALPGVDVELYSAEGGSLANGVKFTYRTASQKIGVKIGTGTEVLSDATVAADTWIGLDWRYDTRTATHTVDWQVDYDSLDTTVAPVAQTQVSQTGMTAADITTVRTGWTTAITATVFYDDLVSSHAFGVYPIGDNRIVPLKVDPTGTPTVFGSSTNFKTFVNNGTMSTWTAADTVARLANIPPIVGGSSSGLAQVTAASGDHVVIPMETFTCAPLYSPRMARMYVAGWAAGNNPATMAAWVDRDDGFGPYGGFSVVADHNWDNSTLRWLAAALDNNGKFSYTQAIVDSLVLHVGRSDDALPDVGIVGALIELCVQPAKVIGIYESDGCTLYVRQDPVNAAVASYVVTTPAGKGATFTYALAGVDQDPVAVPANTIYEQSIGASSIADVTSVGLAPDPSG